VTAGFDGTALLPGPESRRDRAHAAAGGAAGLRRRDRLPAFPPRWSFPRHARDALNPARLFRSRGTSASLLCRRCGSDLLGDSAYRSEPVDCRMRIAWVRGDVPALTDDERGCVPPRRVFRAEARLRLHLVNYTRTRTNDARLGAGHYNRSARCASTSRRRRGVEGARAQGWPRHRPDAAGGTAAVRDSSVVDYEVIAIT